MDIKAIVLSDRQITKFPIPTLMRLLGCMSLIQTLKHSYIQEWNEGSGLSSQMERGVRFIVPAGPYVLFS